MSYGKDAPVLLFDGNSLELDEASADVLPDWIQNAMEEAEDQEDFDRLMANAGSECIENYGCGNEGLEVWKLDSHGWLILHFDSYKPDMVAYITSIKAYFAFQTLWIAPMAEKIMAADRYWFFQMELKAKLDDTPKVH